MNTLLAAPVSVQSPSVPCDLSGPVAGVVPFPLWISSQASYYRSLGTDAGDWLADEIDAHDVKQGHEDEDDDADKLYRLAEAMIARAGKDDPLSGRRCGAFV